MERIFGDLKEFMGKEVALYRSKNFNATALAYLGIDSANRKDAAAYLELLKFEFSADIQRVYVRYPNTDFFVENYQKGFTSGSGLEKSSGIDARAVGMHMKYELFANGNDLLFCAGYKFNFMEKIAQYKKRVGITIEDFKEPSDSFNLEAIMEVLGMKYLKLPMDVRTVQYCYRTLDILPEQVTYFVVDYPTYNHEYKAYRFRSIQNDVVREFEVLKMVRFKDGGTTEMIVRGSDGIEHKLFSPSPLSIDDKSSTWDENPLIDVDYEKKLELINLLKLDVG